MDRVTKIITFPLWFILFIMAVIGTPIEFILTCWMDEPIDFWKSLAKDIIGIYTE